MELNMTNGEMMYLIMVCAAFMSFCAMLIVGYTQQRAFEKRRSKPDNQRG
jgi:hypothetical protein